jgi:hypothetical protein
MKSHRLLCLALLPLLAGGCTLSNRIFEEDPLFTEAVPRADDLRAEHPASRAEQDGARGVGDPADVPPVARDIAGGINGQVLYILAVLDYVLDQPISGRARDSRTWGPYALSSGDGSVRLVVWRDEADPTLFGYSVDLADVSAADVVEETPWDEGIHGSFARGEGGLREGDGSFCFDADVYADHFPDYEGGGLMCAEHGRAGQRIQLRVSYEGWLGADGVARDIEYFFDHRDDLGGVLEYATDQDLLGPSDDEEQAAWRLRWRREGAGRADFLLSGGDLGAVEVPASECWDDAFERVYYYVDMPGAEPDVVEGVEADCVFADREDVREIR